MDNVEGGAKVDKHRRLLQILSSPTCFPFSHDTQAENVAPKPGYIAALSVVGTEFSVCS